MLMEEYLPNLLLDLSLKELAELEDEEEGRIGKDHADVTVAARRAIVVKIIRRRLVKRQRMRRRIHGNMGSCRRAGICLETSGRPFNRFEKKVKNLSTLVPNGKRVSLEDLFVETADYIEGLEMTVKVMQRMVNLFSES